MVLTYNKDEAIEALTGSFLKLHGRDGGVNAGCNAKRLVNGLDDPDAHITFYNSSNDCSPIGQPLQSCPPVGMVRKDNDGDYVFLIIT